MNSYHNLWEDNDTYLQPGGLALMEVRDQVVRNNRAWGNSDHGIMLRTLQDSVIENNIVAGNNRGFFIYDVELRHPARQPGGGQPGRRAPVGGLDAQRGGATTSSPTANRCATWAPRRAVGASSIGASGNHWSNYLGWDRDGDGVGDVPYEANDMVDRCTWRTPASSCCWPALRCRRCAWWASSSRCCACPAWSTPPGACAPTHQNGAEMAWQAFPRPVTLRRAPVAAWRASKHYGALRAVDGVDLDIPRGESSA